MKGLAAHCDQSFHMHSVPRSAGRRLCPTDCHHLFVMTGFLVLSRGLGLIWSPSNVNRIARSRVCCRCSQMASGLGPDRRFLQLFQAPGTSRSLASLETLKDLRLPFPYHLTGGPKGHHKS